MGFLWTIFHHDVMKSLIEIIPSVCSKGHLLLVSVAHRYNCEIMSCLIFIDACCQCSSILPQFHSKEKHAHSAGHPLQHCSGTFNCVPPESYLSRGISLPLYKTHGIHLTANTIDNNVTATILYVPPSSSSYINHKSSQ